MFMCLVCLKSLFRPVFGNWTVINTIYGWIIKKKKDLFAIILMTLISPSLWPRKKPQYFSSVFKSNAR